ncbi:MAG: Holliday junction branch migration protein RuvA [Rhodospirillaceae bacterium]|nr:Holliday junction branch migration protein RuvA [Rhodospirillaceae bacterium]
MIAKLRGLIDSIGEDWVVIDVGGVGYLVFCSTKTLNRLPKIGENTQLFIETHVREDYIHLFGFYLTAERDWFRLLLTVQGIGSKVALAMLSVLELEDLLLAISSDDKEMLSQAQGVGLKLAKRLITELKDKITKFSLSPNFSEQISITSDQHSDAVSALVNLGYRRIEAHTMVLKIANSLGDNVTTNDLISKSLKELGRELT